MVDFYGKMDNEDEFTDEEILDLLDFIKNCGYKQFNSFFFSGRSFEELGSRLIHDKSVPVDIRDKAYGLLDYHLENQYIMLIERILDYWLK
ncbi:MAG: hypothetical protein ACXAD7_13200 [Candidatus Kariarchaeaceae archaeon]